MNINSAICTLFEGDYHYGVGALANSLHAHGFRGTIYAGYRGPLPPWGAGTREYEGFSEYCPVEGLTLRFIPLATKIHLTNYKPDFMLEVWAKHCPNADALFYFDPDIVILSVWSYFEEWVLSGVALCEDINSPIPITHPLRAQWRRIYEREGIVLNFKTDIYVNGGFQGVASAYRNFLKDWQQVQKVMENEIGGLEKTGRDLGGREHPFSKTDQDALNITIGFTPQPVSLMGKEGMDIAPGGNTMAHTIGSAKAWNTPFVRRALCGHPPTTAAKSFFDYARQPIAVLSPERLRREKAGLRAASLIGRFYRKH